VTPEQARDHFGTARVARLATLTASGRPHLVPLVFAIAGQTVFSAVDAKPKRSTELRRLANVAANPHVTLLADHYDEDWTRLWWVRADGTGRVLTPGSWEAQHAIALLVERYRQYLQTPPAGAVLAIDVEHWVGWAAEPSLG
jgi:PPOX class probable F420-dependent enzyme